MEQSYPSLDEILKQNQAPFEEASELIEDFKRVMNIPDDTSSKPNRQQRRAAERRAQREQKQRFVNKPRGD